jgi:hypothetical protein
MLVSVSLPAPIVFCADHELRSERRPGRVEDAALDQPACAGPARPEIGPGDHIVSVGKRSDRRVGLIARRRAIDEPVRTRRRTGRIEGAEVDGRAGDIAAAGGAGVVPDDRKAAGIERGDVRPVDAVGAGRTDVKHRRERSTMRVENLRADAEQIFPGHDETAAGEARHGRVDECRSGHECQLGGDRGAVRVIELGPDETAGGRVEVGIDPGHEGSAIGELGAIGVGLGPGKGRVYVEL